MAVFESLESRTLLSKVPAAPANLKVTASSSTAVTLQWVDESDNESGFRIYRSSDGVNFNELNTTPANTTTYVNGKLKKDLHYYYRVQAYNSAGESKFTHTAEGITGATTAPLSAAPAAPTDLKVTASSSSAVTLVWADNSDNETGFMVYRSSDGVNFNELNTTPANTTTYVNGKLKKGLHYYYRVQAFNSHGSSKFTHTAEGITGNTGSTPSLLAAPANFSVTASSATGATLTWSNETGATSGYLIERSTDGSTYTQINSVGPGVISYVNGKLTSGHTYWYRIRGYNSKADGSYTTAMAVTPGAASTPPTSIATPSNLKATAASSTSINLTWTGNANNESGFKIERSADGGTTFTQVGTTSANVATFSDTGLVAGTAYTYRVRAYSGSSNSGYSTTASATTTTAALIAPNNLVTASLSDSAIRVSWTGNSTSETGFDIERSTNQTTFVQAGVVDNTMNSFIDSGLLSSTKYYYRVRAFNAAGAFSPYSNVVSRTTLSDSSGGSSDHSWASGGTGVNATGNWAFDGVTITLAADPATVIPILKELHVGSVRTYFTTGGATWATTGGADGLAAAKAYHDAGFKVLMQIGGNKVPTGTQATDYYNYVVNSGVLPYVDEFEIGNEPNIPGNWNGTAQQYVDTELEPAWNILHPLGATIVGAGPSWDVTYAQTLVTDGYLNFCDIADFHPYGSTPQQIYQRAEGAIAAYAGRPTVFTEWSIRNVGGAADWSADNTATRALLATTGAQQAFYFPLVYDGSTGSLGGKGGLITLPDYQPVMYFFDMFQSWGDPVSPS